MNDQLNNRAYLLYGACRYHCWNYRLLTPRVVTVGRIDRVKNFKILFQMVTKRVR